MKTLDKLLEKGKKQARKLIMLSTLGACIAAFSASEAKADLKKVWQEIKDRTSIEASYSYSKPDPLKDFYSQLNENARKGNYTGGVQIPEWRDMKSPETLAMPGIGVNFKVWENKDKGLAAYLTGRYEKGKASPSYDETYQRYNPYYGNFTVTANRNEEYKASKLSLGARISKELSNKVNASGSANLDFHNIKGDADMTSMVSATNYTQWRDVNYSGKTTGFSLEGAIDYEITKNISFGAGIEFGSASVNTSGKEIKTASTNPGLSWTYDYNPTFDLGGIGIKALARIKF